MADLILTEAEKAAESYLDWDDAALGRFTKYIAATIEKHKDDADGLHRVTAASAAMLLVASCVDANAGSLMLKLEGHTHGDVLTGDWLITVKKTGSGKI